jgi:hypothetical protein
LYQTIIGLLVLEKTFIILNVFSLFCYYIFLAALYLPTLEPSYIQELFVPIEAVIGPVAPEEQITLWKSFLTDR